jgi:hypothetical protein
VYGLDGVRAPGARLWLDRPVELLRTFDPQVMSDALKAWEWIGLDGKTPMFTSAFGNVFLRAADGFWFLDRLAGTLTRPWETAGQLQDELDTPDGQSLYLSAGLVWAANEGGLVPSETEVYDFAVPPILGGGQDLANVDVTDFTTALGISGQIHEQLRGVPPGTPIKLQFDDPID